MQDPQKVYEAVASVVEVELVDHKVTEESWMAMYRHPMVGEIVQQFDKPYFSRLSDEQLVTMLANDLLWRIRVLQRGDDKK